MKALVLFLSVFALALAGCASPVEERVDRGDRLTWDHKADEASAAYLNAIQLDVTDTRVYLRLAWTLISQGTFDKTLATFRAALRLKPDHVQTHIYLGLTLFHNDDLVKATKALDTAIRLDPKNAGAHKVRGMALEAQGKHEEAEQEYAIAKKLRGT